MTREPFDAPKVQIETSDGLGGRKIQQMTLQTNRVATFSEAIAYWGDVLAVPARPGCLFTDLILWLSAIGMIGRLLYLLASVAVTPALMLFFMLYIPVQVAGLIAFVQLPELRIALLYRFALMIAALLLAIL